MLWRWHWVEHAKALPACDPNTTRIFMVRTFETLKETSFASVATIRSKSGGGCLKGDGFICNFVVAQGCPPMQTESELGMKSALLCPYRSTIPPRERFYALPFLSF